MKSFSQYIQEVNMPEVYCDMDGVLVNLYKGIHQLLGRTDLSQKDMDAFFHSDEGSSTVFWANLPWQSDGKVLWKHLQRYDTHILSACPSVCGNDKDVIKGKTMWCKTNLGIQTSRIHIVQRREKKDYAKPGAILIDDNRKTCKEFESAGGIAVYHTKSSKSIKQLIKIKDA